MKAYIVKKYVLVHDWAPHPVNGQMDTDTDTDTNMNKDMDVNMDMGMNRDMNTNMDMNNMNRNMKHEHWHDCLYEHLVTIHEYGQLLDR